MKIVNSTGKDIQEIFRLYKIATDFQKIKFSVHWPEFDRKLIEMEIAEERQWKIIIDNQIACIWATTFNDPQIWEERNNDPAVYIHRIATNPEFRWQNFVRQIVEWAKPYALKNEKEFIRMDTVGDNPGLITYYIKCGFNFGGLLKLQNTEGLPAHYDNATVSLFQIGL
jgi:GNAT superfamily N-acetyltransferase